MLFFAVFNGHIVKLGYHYFLYSVIACGVLTQIFLFLFTFVDSLMHKDSPKKESIKIEYENENENIPFYSNKDEIDLKSNSIN
jgi:hypothetical protein